MDQPRWQAEEGCGLIDNFHFAFGEYEFTAASQAVLAIEHGEEERGSRLSEVVPMSTLVWTCITDDAPTALRKLLQPVHSLTWLHGVPGHIMYYRKKWSGGSTATGKDLRKERQKGWTKPWPPASVEMFKARAMGSSKAHDLFEVLADWIESSADPSDNAQQLWEMGGFFNASLCRRLVIAGAFVDCKLWKDERTALQIVASLWEHDLIQLLMELGADAGIHSSNDYNALYWFLNPDMAFPGEHLERFTWSRRHIQGQIGNPRHEKIRIAASVTALAQSSTVDAPLIDGTTPLMHAVRYSATATKTLLEKRANLESRDSKGRTALMHFFLGAFNGRSVRILKHLLDAGADSLAFNSENNTVLGYWSHTVLRKELSDIYAGSNSYNKAFHQLASAGPLSRRDILVQHLADLKVPLVVAARLGNAELCWALLESGVHPDKHGVPKGSPMGFNSGSEANDLEDLAWNPVLVALHAKAYVTTAVLFSYGADVGYQVPKRKRTKYNKYRLGNGLLTPLHLAVAVQGSEGWHARSPSILLSTGERQSCLFSAATHPDHPVKKKSPREMISKRQRKTNAKVRARVDDVPSSDVSDISQDIKAF